MLRSLARHLNETVFRGPDDESGSGVASTTTDVADDGAVGAGDAGGDNDSGGDIEEPQEKLTVREQLKRSMDEAREDEKPQPTKREKKSGRFTKEAAPAPAADAAPAVAAPAQDDVPAPASLSPEAKAAWAAAPKEIKEAFVKREADMQKGVDELKQRYSQIDQAIAPHNDALRQMNATPAQAVDRMFLWFKALAGTPDKAFPALAQSMGIDWGKLSAAINGGQQQQPQGQQVQQQTEGAPEGVPEIHPLVRDHIARLEQQIQAFGQGFQQFDGRFQTMEEQVQQQNMARTTENLNIWSKDKTHFAEVRQEMAELLQKGMIPLLPDGQVDLDKAYEHAIYLNPTVRAKVIAEQRQADQKAREDAEKAATAAQQQQAAKARKTAVSLPAGGPPGDGNATKTPKQKPGQKTSVRDSLKAAMAELRDQ